MRHQSRLGQSVCIVAVALAALPAFNASRAQPQAGQTTNAFGRPVVTPTRKLLFLTHAGYYTSFGHRDDIWSIDPVFQAHLTGGILWALSLEN